MQLSLVPDITAVLLGTATTPAPVASSLVQDIAIVLLSAGLAGIIFKKIGLSVIVGYLLAGVVIGPNTPIHMISDEARIAQLAQVGLVFVMFAIGLNLSLTKLAKMGLSTIFATALGAVFVFMLTVLLGQSIGWSSKQSIFVAAMLMVSSSAVIAKIIQELHLSHNKTAQLALTITVMEDIVAVVMLTILANVGAEVPSGMVPDAESVGTAVAATGGGDGVREMGGVFTKISSFVILILGLCLVMVPKLLHRLDTSGDLELRTIGIGGLLLLLALCAERAGFSLALGAFLFGAIVAELPQKEAIEKSFDSVRSIFSSLFFVSIGMMAKPAELLKPEALSMVGSLIVFAMFVRPLACGFALILVGAAPHEAKRGGLLLTPLGEFTFIIAQAAVTAKIFDTYFYPVAITLSVATVLITPIVNRFAEPIVCFFERLEPSWLVRVQVAYHDWLKQMQKRPSVSKPVWKLVRRPLVQVGVEMLLVTGLLRFSLSLLGTIEEWMRAKAVTGSGNAAAVWLASGRSLAVLFWVVVGVAVLMFLVSIVRNVMAATLILAGGLKSRILPRQLLANGFNAAAAALLLFWLYSIVPFDFAAVALGMRVAILAALAGVMVVFSRKLTYWHSAWRVSVESVLSNGGSPVEAREEARRNLGSGLEPWDIHLQECLVPDNAAYAGKSLHELAIPSRFGSVVVEVERNGHSIVSPGPQMRLYPGDKLSLLGENAEIEQARAFLESKEGGARFGETFSRVVLEPVAVGKSPRTGKSFIELAIVQETGVRVVGIQRGEQRIINPTGSEVLREGDGLLLMGTLEQVRYFNRWLAGEGEKK